ncbi:MAG: GIY-YIG nuclease family protein [Polyangiaceae bacterium]|nr:GIY-YIG nuclease family protein [Polyangiaceae bacterium]MCE7894659.1 GIY-YIG nuclease family protein [Sorangiineae bacterium PRO1]MCL4751599.1 GIY-YIG nuclease family protein [Myxococcales bacterium]
MASSTDTWFVYLARCADGSLYTGIAKNVAERIRAHDAGKGARYTRGRGPLSVCATRRCLSKGVALRLELQVKRLSRKEKEAIADPVQFRAFARRCLRS